MNYGTMPEDKLILSFGASADGSTCELPITAAPAVGPDSCVVMRTKDLLDSEFHIADVNHSWVGYDWLQMLVYSESHSGAAVNFFAETESTNSDPLCGYCFPFNISWTGWKILTFPLGYGFVTRGTPSGFEKIKSYQFSMPLRYASPVETVLHISRAWLTKNPTPDIVQPFRDPGYDFLLEGKQNPAYQAVSLLNKQHPRLILTPERVNELKGCIQTVPFVQKSYQNLLEYAESILALPTIPHALPDGRRLVRTPCFYIQLLALAYLLSGRTEFMDRLWQELQSVCLYPDWNQQHDIDVGDYSRPVALAYDWLYDEWTEDQRRLMRNAMMRNGLLPMISALRNKVGFASNEGNHNEVTASGLGMIGLALGDEPGYENIANEVIHLTVECIPINLKPYAPYGVCVEGVGYWSYGQDAYYLYEAALCSALGTDFGLQDLSGMDVTGDFLLALNSPIGKSFNYADAADKYAYSPSLLWLAQLYNKYEYAQFYIERSAQLSKDDALRYVPLELLYFKDGMEKSDQLASMKKDHFFGFLGSMLSSTTDRNAWHVAFKGGIKALHMDLDCGSFVLDALGERWVCELGLEAYDMPGMWNYTVDAGRWMYYRKRAEGNNTLVIDPKYDPKCIADQNPNAVSEIIYTESSDDRGVATIDLTSAYGQPILRSFILEEHRSKFTVKDEIDLDKDCELFSFFHTQAEISLSEDKKHAKLFLNGKTMNVCLDTDTDGELIVMDAEPLLTEYREVPHASNSEFRKLAVHCQKVSHGYICVTFTL